MWQIKKLGDIATFINGKAFKPTDWSDEGLPIIRIQNLTNSINDIHYYKGNVVDKYKITTGDILISWSATIDVFEWLKGDAVLNQHIFKVVFDKEPIDKNFFKYLIKQKIGEMLKNVHGSTMKHITKGDFDNIEVILPPLEEQKKIAQILDKADEIRTKKRLANDKLDEFLKSTFIDMFGDPVKNTKKFQVKLLKDISTIISGGTPSRQHKEYFGGNIPWVTTVALGKNYIDRNDAQDYLTELGVEKSATHIIPKNSLLFGSRVGVGKTSVNLCDICTNQDILSITNIDSDIFNMTFIKKVLEQYTAYFETQKRGATIKGISADVVKNISIPIAPIDLQNKYLRIVEHVESQKQKNEQVIEQMDNLFNSLSQRAFKGEL